MPPVLYTRYTIEISSQDIISRGGATTRRREPSPPPRARPGAFSHFRFTYVITTWGECGPGSVAGNKNSSMSRSTRLSLLMIDSLIQLLNSLLVSSFVRFLVVWAGVLWVKLQKNTKFKNTRSRFTASSSSTNPNPLRTICT